jgi:hypothetical protein
VLGYREACVREGCEKACDPWPEDARTGQVVLVLEDENARVGPDL